MRTMSTSDITFLTARALWKPGLIEEITRDEWKSNTAREFSATNSIFRDLIASHRARGLWKPRLILTQFVINCLKI